MIVKPKVRGFICTTAHPVGCEAVVKKQIDYVKAQGKVNGPKKVLVVGSSMGYGLASRIAAAYGSGASTSRKRQQDRHIRLVQHKGFREACSG